MKSNSSGDTPLSTDTVISARWVIPMHTKEQILEHHSVVVRDEKIVAIGPTKAILADYSGTQHFNLDTHVLIPGLINAHGHSAMSLLRGYADDLSLLPWLEEKIWPAEAQWMSEDFVRDGANLAIAEMLRSGTTCFSDMYFFPDQVAKSAIASKIRVQLAAPILDFPTVWAQNSEEYIHKVTVLHDQYRNNDYVHTAFGPHSAYTVSDGPLQKIAMLAEELDLPVHIHLHENADEVRNALSNTGFRHIARLKQLDVLGPRMQCVHMTQLLDEEIDLLAELSVNVVHCPASNMKLASGFCRTKDLLAAGVNVSLGTDSTASNNDLDMFSEMRLAALAGKASSGDAGALNAWEILQMATINGARAMGLDDRIGTIETGKWADLTAVNLDALNTQPVYDPASALVYSCHSNQVSHVWVAGQLNLEEGKLTAIDTDQIKAVATQWADRIQAKAS